MKLERMWINQPSRLQPDHKWNGERVLAAVDYQPERPVVRVYFLRGAVVSQEMLRLSLSPGWPEAGDRDGTLAVLKKVEARLNRWAPGMARGPEGADRDWETLFAEIRGAIAKAEGRA